MEVGKNEKEVLRAYLLILSESHHRLFGVLKEKQESLEGLFPRNDDEDEEKTAAERSAEFGADPEAAAAFGEWVESVGEEMKTWFKVIGDTYRHLENEPKLARYIQHDVGNEVASAIGFADLMLAEINNKRDPAVFNSYLCIFINYWERYWVPVQDVLLRYLSDTDVPPEYIKDLDLETLQRLLGYFETQEVVGLRKKSAMKDSKYHDIGEKKLKLYIDWEALSSALGGGAVKGNEGVVYNFILNSLRNALKDLVEARNVSASVVVEGDELVVRVMDDGKGITISGLTPDNDSFIFKEGSSGTKSTGLGLSNSDQRIKSVGGSLSVVSFNKEEGKINTYSNAPDFKFNLDEFNRKREVAGDVKVNTVFEIRLPITKK